MQEWASDPRLLDASVRDAQKRVRCGYLKSGEGLDDVRPLGRRGYPTAGANPCGSVVVVFTVTLALGATHWVFQLKATPASRAVALQQYPAPPPHARTRALSRSLFLTHTGCWQTTNTVRLTMMDGVHNLAGDMDFG